MTTHQQEQQTDQEHARGKQRRRLLCRTVVIITVLILAIAIIITWILSYLNVIPSFWASIFTIIITVLGAVFAFFQSMHLFIAADRGESHEFLTQRSPDFNIPLPPSSQIPPIILQLPTNQSPLTQPLALEKTAHRGIVGLPPPTDPRTIQQREQVVKEVYTKLIQLDIAAIALTGIGGIGKSTLAALIFRYAEEQRHAHFSPFLAETLWLTIDPFVTFADLVGNLFEVLGKPLPDLSNLAPQNQAVALFNALNKTDKPRLIILDQFENLLDWNTGHALADRPGVGEWLDIINSQPCACHILLTSRPRPVGTREYPPTYLQEYAVGGLEMNEGIELLRTQGVQGTETELHATVSHCAGHAFSLTLLASLMRDHHMNLETLFKNAALWTGDIATNLLDQIYTLRLTEVQRELLSAFSVYREPVPLNAAQALIPKSAKFQVSSALKTLLTQHLLEAVGKGLYQLHTIIAEYAQGHFDESSELANEETLKVAHTRAAQYYQQRAVTGCPSRDKRRGISDVHDLVEAIWQYCQAEKWQKAYNLMEYEYLFADLSRWGEYAVLQELYELVLPLNKWHPQRTQEARIDYNLGNLYRVLGKTEQAREYLDQALSLYKEVKDRSQEGWVLRNLGRVYSDVGNIKQADEYYKAALTIHKDLGDVIGEGVGLANLGWIYYSSGQLEKARQYYEKALDIHKDTCNSREESYALNNLGRVYRVMGEKMQAHAYYERALTIIRREGDRLGEGWTLHNLGKVYNDLGQNEHALECLEQALSVRREIGDLRGVGGTLEAIGRLHLSLGELEQACNYYKLGLRISKEIGDIRGEANALNNLGKVCSMLEQKTQAMKYFKLSMDIRKKLEDRSGGSSTLYHVGKYYFGRRQYDVALSCFLLDKKFLDEIQHPYREEAQIWIEKIQNALGNEQFSALLTTVEPHAQEIVDQALCPVPEIPNTKIKLNMGESVSNVSQRIALETDIQDSHQSS